MREKRYITTLEPLQDKYDHDTEYEIEPEPCHPLVISFAYARKR